jgi:hypothetical protein
MSKPHRVFVSYHQELDEKYKERFVHRFGGAYGTIISAGVDLGDIDPNLRTETIRTKIRDEYLRSASVTVVLVGKLTWQRKYVDWEIASTLHDTKLHARGGLLGILLPVYRTACRDGKHGRGDPHTIPPRLHDNVEAGFAKLYDWSESGRDVRAWIHEAFLRKTRVEPDNHRNPFGRNQSGRRWA